MLNDSFPKIMKDGVSLKSVAHPSSKTLRERLRWWFLANFKGFSKDALEQVFISLPDKHYIKCYECHITMRAESTIFVEEKVTSLGWKFSKIDGDPALGPGIKMYATRYFKNHFEIEQVIREMTDACVFLESFGISVIRQKIEGILWDKITCA